MTAYEFVSKLLFSNTAPDGAKLYPDHFGPLQLVVSEEPAILVPAPDYDAPPVTFSED